MWKKISVWKNFSYVVKEWKKISGKFVRSLQSIIDCIRGFGYLPLQEIFLGAKEIKCRGNLFFVV